MPGILVLLSVLFQPGYPVQQRSTIMPDLETCEQGAEMLRQQVAFAFPDADLQVFCIDVRPHDKPALLELPRSPA